MKNFESCADNTNLKDSIERYIRFRELVKSEKHAGPIMS